MPGVLLCCSVHQAYRRAPLAGVLLCRLAHQALKGGLLLCSSVCQALDGPASLLFRCQCWHVGRERLWWWLYPLCVTQQYCLASMAAWLSSTGVSHHNLLPHIPSTSLSTINGSPHPGIAPESLNSSSQLLCLPGDLHPCLGYVWLWQGLSDSHST